MIEEPCVGCGGSGGQHVKGCPMLELERRAARFGIGQLEDPLFTLGKAATPAALTNERKNTHGDWLTQSALADNLMFQISHSEQWQHMGASRRQALFNIAQKISRICTGDSEEDDHWDDIAGYAYLAKGGHKEA